MKKIIEKIYATVAFLKVLSLVLGAAFAVFWFYRFFNMPYANAMTIFFDIPSKIIVFPFDTFFTTEKGNVIENAYFIDGILCIILAIVFHFFEFVVLEIQRIYELSVINTKQNLEKKINTELKNEYYKNLANYTFFSLYIKLETTFINEILANHNLAKPDEILEKTYKDMAEFIKAAYPSFTVRSSNEYIFVSGKDFSNFEKFLSKVLNALKHLKDKNEKVFINTNFIIVIDAQTSKEKSMASLRKLKEIADAKYQNSAIVTLEFKMCFELLKSEKFEIDLLGYVAGGEKHTLTDTDLYRIKTKKIFI